MGLTEMVSKRNKTLHLMPTTVARKKRGFLNTTGFRGSCEKGTAGYQRTQLPRGISGGRYCGTSEGYSPWAQSSKRRFLMGILTARRKGKGRELTQKGDLCSVDPNVA